MTAIAMDSEVRTIGFGGGCHWCTEAVFDVLRGVRQVEQGWIASTPPDDAYSEAVLVHYAEDRVSLEELVAIHLATHSSTSTHALRSRYRSAVYVLHESDRPRVAATVASIQAGVEQQIITQVLPFGAFRLNEERYLHYYKKHREGQFCESYIEPKWSLLREQFAHLYREG